MVTPTEKISDHMDKESKRGKNGEPGPQELNQFHFSLPESYLFYWTNSIQHISHAQKEALQNLQLVCSGFCFHWISAPFETRGVGDHASLQKVKTNLPSKFLYYCKLMDMACLLFVPVSLLPWHLASLTPMRLRLCTDGQVWMDSGKIV